MALRTAGPPFDDLSIESISTPIRIGSIAYEPIAIASSGQWL